MSNTFDGFVGKTVERVAFANERISKYGEQDVLVLHFTDGSMLTVCEAVPDICWNGLKIEICESMNGGVK
jgi:hypothetical protein